jgi:hypothetical protein
MNENQPQPVRVTVAIAPVASENTIINTTVHDELPYEAVS